MAYKLIDCDSYISIEFKGKTSLAENDTARDELILTLRLKGKNSVLVDMSKADLSEITLEELVEFGKGWEVDPTIGMTKFATLIPENNPFRDKIDLSLTVGLYEGVQLKVFQVKELALAWLKT